MSSPSASSARALDEILSRLSGAVGIAHRGPDRLSIGPGGVFVLHPLESSESPRDAAEHAWLLAETTRDRIADHLTWVPFVDWLVIAEAYSAHIPSLPSGLVATTLLEGHAIPPTIANELRRSVSMGNLSPLWQPGLPPTSNLALAVSQIGPLS